MTFASLVMVVLAQTAAPAGETLTLRQALETAQKQNLDLKVAQARLDQSQLISRKVWAGYLPTITVGGSYTYNSTEARIRLPQGYYIRDVGQPQGPAFNPSQEISETNPPGAQTPYILYPSSFAEVPIQLHNQWGAQAQINQALIAPALWPAIQSAYIAEKVAALSVDSARRDILFGVAQLYYGAVTLKETSAVQERLLETQKAHEKDAEVRYNAGAAPKVLLLRAQIDRSRAEQDVIRSKNAYESAKMSLATLLDRPANFEVVRPEAEIVSLEKLPNADESLERRPDVLAARESVNLAESNRRGTWFKYLPNIGASGTYRISNVTGFTGQKDSWFITVGLNWTLWDGGLRETELRETAAKIAEAEASLKNTENKARNELAQAMIDMESAKANQVKSQEELKLARENASIVDVNFKAGAATYLEVADSNTALRQAELGALVNELNLALAEIRVAKAAGLFGAEIPAAQQ